MSEKLSPTTAFGEFEETVKRPIETEKKIDSPEQDIANELIEIRSLLEQSPTSNWPESTTDKHKEVLEMLDKVAEDFYDDQARPATLRMLQEAEKTLIDISFDVRELGNQHIMIFIRDLIKARVQAEARPVVKEGETVWRGTDKGEVVNTVSNEQVLVRFDNGEEEMVRQLHLKTAEEKEQEKEAAVAA